MAKKDFTKKIGTKNLSSLIPTETPAPKANPKVEPKPEAKPKKVAPKPAPEKKMKKAKNEGSTVTTFRIDNEHLAAIKALAFWDRKKIQEVMYDALEAYIKGMPESTLKKAKAEYPKKGGGNL